MTTTQPLVSLSAASETSLEGEFIWIRQTKINSWNAAHKIEWTPYSNPTSSVIESAYQRGDNETVIDQTYRIDLKHFVEVRIDDSNEQRPIRRQLRCCSSVLSDIETERENSRSERLSFSLNSVLNCSTSEDTNYHGSSFITDWLLKFTKGKLNVTFNSIFPVLVQGLQYEGQSAPVEEIEDIVTELNDVKARIHGKKEEKKIQDLKVCCAKLYTKECYIFRAVNTALRDNDRSKLETLGPYCYLVYNYIGRDDNNLSIYHRFRQRFGLIKSQSMVVYRGDYISSEVLEKYRRASGNNAKYFKWLPFVSTSLRRNVAEVFAHNVLYIIELQHHSTNDQFTSLNTISAFREEEEIILRPGVRFLVDKMQFDELTERHLVYIKIVPSYVSHLR